MPLTPDQEVLARVYRPQLAEYRATLAKAREALQAAEGAWSKADDAFRAATTVAGRAAGKVEALEALMAREGIPVEEE